MKCWRCGQEISEGTGVCTYCGAGQTRGAASSEVGRALRTLYDRYGCREVLTQSAYVVSGLGDLLEDSRKIRNLFRAALDSGMGKLYLEQLRLSGKPDEAFSGRVRILLTEDAGLSDSAARQLSGWFDEMIGWTAPERRTSASSSFTGREKPRGGPGAVIGIDLGTSFSRVAVMEGGKPVIIPTPEGKRAMPSMVGAMDGRALLGEQALRLALLHPENVAACFVRSLGRTGSIGMAGTTFSPQFLTALLLRKLRRNAEDYLGTSVAEAVITVPDVFTTGQRQAMLDAAKIAGLPVRRLINASSAAALACTFGWKGERTILVCDLGGGTIGVSVVNYDDGSLEVLSCAGSCQLGGDDFDARIVQWLAEQFRKKTGIDVRPDPAAMSRLKAAAEQAKKELSGIACAHIHVPRLAVKSGVWQDIDLDMPRTTFGSLTGSLLETASGFIREALEASGRGSSGIDSVILTGGASRTPGLQAAARGIIDRDIIRSFQPDESTALGAAIQAGRLSGEVNCKNILLLDVAANSLGVETAGGVFTRLIERGATIPAAAIRRFTTVEDNQSNINVHVMEGENERAAENVSLGKYNISGIPPAKKGVPEIEVNFGINANGIASAKAKEKGSGKAWTLDIPGAIGLDEKTIEHKARLAARDVP